MPAKAKLKLHNNSFLDLAIYQFGSHKSPPNLFRFTLCHHYIFFHITRGKGRFITENDNKERCNHYVEAGQCFLIHPSQVASFEADELQPWSYFWIEFDGLKARERIAQIDLTPSQPIYTGQNVLQHTNMVDAISYIINNPNADQFDLIGHCYIFLSNLSKGSTFSKQGTQGANQSQYVKEIISYIDRHYSSDMSVEDIATHCNLDRSYIGRVFKAAMGISLRAFLIQYRITKACEFMKTTTLSVGEVGGMVGYSNMFNFSRAFKSVMGISPKQWRVKATEEEQQGANT